MILFKEYVILKVVLTITLVTFLLEADGIYYLREAKKNSYSIQDSVIVKQLDSLRKQFNRSDFNYGSMLKEALEINEKLNSSSNLKLKLTYRSNLILGDILDRTSNYKEALVYFKRAKESMQLSLEKSDGDQLSQYDYGNSLLRLGRIYQKIGIKDSARFYYNKVDKIPSFNTRIRSLKAISYSNISGLLQLDSLFSDARVYSEKAVEIHRELGNSLNLSYSLNSLGSIYLSEGNFQRSKELYEEGIHLLQNDESEPAVRSKANLYYNLAWAMYNLKEYKAYDFQEKYYLINDRIRDNNFREIIEEVRAKHNVDIVKKEAQVQAAEASRKTWIIVGSGVLIITALSFLLYSYRLRQRNLALDLKRKESEQKRKLSQLKAESQSLILNAAIDGRESERREIAETLHDNVSTLLSSANLHLQACKTQFNGNTPEEVDKTQVIINEASQKIRDLSHTLVSSVLLKFGISFAVNDMIKKYSNSKIQFEGSIQNLPRYNQKFEIKVYNIIQELVNNVLKHSGADSAFIKLSENTNVLAIQITDNGKGFDKTKVSIKDGIGINQIDARIQMMNGKFEINSKRNQGTTIEIELPIYELETSKTA